MNRLVSAFGATALCVLASACNFGHSDSSGSDGGSFESTTGQLSFLNASTSHQDFGTVAVGTQSASATITLTNAGGGETGVLAAALGGAGDAAFGIDADSCSGRSVAAGASCSVQVHFKPSAAGQAAATLDVSTGSSGGASVDLTGTGAAPESLAFTPTTQDLGTAVVAGAAGAPASFTLTNAGGVATGNVAVQLTGADASSFSLASDTCSGKPLAAGATCAVGVAFAPKAAGARTASLSASAPGAAGTATASLSGTAVTAPALAVSPSPFDFGPVEEGAATPPSQTFTVKNTGGSASSAAPAVAVSGADAKDFTLANDTCKTALAAGAGCAFDVIFAPTTAAAESAAVAVTAPQVPSVSVALAGTGLAPAALGVSPGSGALGSVVQGATGTDTTFTVTNGGGVVTGSLTAAVAGSQAAQFALGADTCTGHTVVAGGTCTVAVHAAPLAGGPVGSISASLEVSGTPGGAAAATLSATAIAPANLTVSPASQPMGSIVQGATSTDFGFVFTNSGGAPSGALKTALAGANAVDFGLGTDGCNGKTLAAGASCTVDVHFAPATAALGTLTATISATAAPGGTATASATGTAITAASIAISPATEPFASVAQGAVSADTTFTVTNGGGGATGKLSVALGGANAGQFAIGADDCTGQTLAGTTGKCTVTAHFAPSIGTLGAQAATLTVTGAPGGSTVANLTGTATSPLSIGPASPTLASGAFQAPGATTTLTITSASALPVGPLTVTIPAQFAIDASKTTCSQATLTKAAPTCTVGVYLSPAAATVVGAQSGVLTVAAGAGTTATDTLAATALTPATLSITTTAGVALPVSFGTVRVKTPGTQSFQVTNEGAVASGAVTVAVSGAAPGSKDFVVSSGACSAGLAVGASCDFQVTFTPSTTSAESATLGATTTAGVGTSGTVSGSGGQATLQFQGAKGNVIASHPFGGVLVPTPGVVTPPGSVTVYLANVGTSPASKLSPSTLPNVFTSPSDACSGQSLAVGATCAITLDFQTTTIAENDAATFTIGDGTVSASLPLTGTGIGAGVYYMVTPAPGTLSVNPGSAGSTTFVIENYGTTTGPSVSFGLDGSQPTYGWFSKPSDTCTGGAGLATLGTCQVTFTATVPATAAAQKGNLDIAIVGAGQGIIYTPTNSTVIYTVDQLTIP